MSDTMALLIVLFSVINYIGCIAISLSCLPDNELPHDLFLEIKEDCTIFGYIVIIIFSTILIPAIIFTYFVWLIEKAMRVICNAMYK